MGACGSNPKQMKKSKSEGQVVFKTKEIEQKVDNEENAAPPQYSRSNTARHQLRSVVDTEPKTPDLPKMEMTRAELVEVTKEKTEADKLRIRKTLSSHFYFKDLRPETINALIDNFKYYIAAKGINIYYQGQPAVNFYILMEGKAMESSMGGNPRQIKAGEAFGEVALMKKTERKATVTTGARCCMWVLNSEVFQGLIQQTSENQRTENITFLKSVQILRALKDGEKEAMADCLEHRAYSPNQAIITEGDTGDDFFIIKSGNVKVTKAGEEIRQMYKGEYFGEQALLYQCPRTATIKAHGPVEVLTLKRDELIEILGSNLKDILYQNTIRMALEANPVLKQLQPSQMISIARAVNVEEYSHGVVILKANVPNTKGVMCVVQGEIEQDGETVARTFECLGGEQLAEDSRSDLLNPVDLVAKGLTEIAYISKQEVEKCLGGSIQSSSDKSQLYSILSQVPLLQTLNSSSFRALADAVTTESFPAGSKIIEAGQIGDKFYIIKSGQVDVFVGDTKVRTSSSNDYFGERAILLQEPRSATVIALRDTQCWSLRKNDFMACISPEVVSMLHTRIELRNDQVQLDDLQIIKQLGEGMFGSVFLCSVKNGSLLYALKCVSRAKIINHSIAPNLINEREILMQIESNFVMKLVRTYKDDKRVYFLFEYIDGEDLFDAIRNINIVDNNAATFYIGCLVLGLQALAGKNVIHRDLKPENIMVDKYGYAKIIDFGTAKILEGRTQTVVGTPHYMAPEVVMQRGYSFSADIWSLGIMLYELVVGYLPFGEEEEDPVRVYESVLTSEVQYPKNMKNLKSKGIINEMLTRNAHKRIKLDAIVGHKWYENFDWESLITKQMVPKYKPKVSKLDINQKLKGTMDTIISSFEKPERIRNKRPPPPNWDKNF